MRRSRTTVEQDDRRLLKVLDRDWRHAAGRAGPWLACAPGCDDCCHGPFPITRLDVRRLRRGMDELARRDPERSRALARRASRAIERLQGGFPGDPASGRLARDIRWLDDFFGRHTDLVCPALDPATGRCELYAWRPVSCRAYGPPLRFGETPSPPCPRCFRGAEPATLEACRIKPDRADLERDLLDRLGVAADEDWETLVAFAIGRQRE